MVKYLINSIEQSAKEIRSEIKIASDGICNCVCPHINQGYYFEGKLRFCEVNGDDSTCVEINNLRLLIKLKAEEYPLAILKYCRQAILKKSLQQIYAYYSAKELADKHAYERVQLKGIKLCILKVANSFLIYPIENLTCLSRDLNEEIRLLEGEISHNSYRKGTYKINYTKIVNCDGTNLPMSLEDRKIKKEKLNILENAYDKITSKVSELKLQFFNTQEDRINQFNKLYHSYKSTAGNVCEYINFLLSNSVYGFLFAKYVQSEYDVNTRTLIVDYQLPNRDQVPVETVNKSDKWVELAISKQKKLYDDIIYAIVIRSLAEICHYDEKKYINHICFNGKIKDRSPLTGQMEEKYILSVNVSREQVESLNLEFIDPKECFKYLKGVSASKLYEQTEIRPILTPSFSDKRIVKAREVATVQSTNLAAMDWEEFEHLVRQVFEWEFSDKGGEVNVTQSSRDGGVDAIVFDPDPIRGGKIIIQAKRYTNTVPVSAVRDLYGTIINEGANKGILITTSDYGPDSYKFAQGKPITLLNGGHLLYLMEKHGRHARIDIQEAKNKNKGIN